MKPAERLKTAIQLNQDLAAVQRALRALQLAVNSIQARAIADLADATVAAGEEHDRLDALTPSASWPKGSGTVQ